MDKKIFLFFLDSLRCCARPLVFFFLWIERYALFSLVRKKYQKSTRRACEPSRLPGNTVKLRLRFATQVLRRYWKFHIMRKRKMRSFSLLFYYCVLTQAVFYEILGFLLQCGFGLLSKFSCLRLWHENGPVFAVNKN